MEHQETYHCTSPHDETGVVVGYLVAICFLYERCFPTPWRYRKESRSGVAVGMDTVLGASPASIENKHETSRMIQLISTYILNTLEHEAIVE